MHSNIDSNSLFDGQLHCSQHRQGYRFSIDAVLLAHYISVKENDRILDIGTGSGIISLILLYRHVDLLSECSGVEIQKDLFDLAQSNMKKNNYDHKNNIFHCDVKNIKEYCLAESYDRVVCNPPFYPQNTGRNNLIGEANIARHQKAGGLEDFLAGAAHAVKNRGSVYFIYPAELLAEFLATATLYNLEGKNLRFIYNYPNSTKGAKLVLIKATKNGGKGLVVTEPLYIYAHKNGPYTPEVDAFYKK